MNADELLNTIGESNLWGGEIDTGIERQGYLQRMEQLKSMKEAVAIVGARCAGKSTIAKQFLKSCVNAGLKKEQTLYVNFDEPIFSPMLNTKLIEDIYTAYRVSLNPDGPAVIVLDEVQNIDAWEKWVRTKLEKSKGVKIIVTGSSSKLLSSEFSTVMSGRSIPLAVFPLSFKEYLGFKSIEIKKAGKVLLNRSKIQHMLLDYIEYGGFPRAVLEKKENRNLLLTQYFETIMLRDIVARHGVRDSGVARALATLMLTDIASPKSIGKLAALLQKAFGHKVSLETVSRFITFFEEAYLLFPVPIFSYKAKDHLQYPKKAYCIDTGIRNAVSFRFAKDKGKMYENAVFIELKRRGKDVHYWKGKGEVDFVIKEKLHIKEAIQVCYDIHSEGAEERETKALLEAMDEFKLKKSMILTADYSDKKRVGGRIIEFKPLWEWLLE